MIRREPHLEMRHVGHRGQVIAPHRSILTLRLGGGRFFFAVGLAFGLCWAWILLMAPVARAWAELFDQIATWIAVPASSAIREVDVLGGRWQLLLPRIELASAEPTRTQWWWGLALTAIAFVVSYVLPRRHLPVLYWLRLVALVQASAQLVFWLFPGAFPYEIGGYTEVLLIAGAFVIGLVPWIYGLTYSVLAVSPWRILGLNLLAMAHLVVFVPLQIMAHAWLIHQASLLWMPLVFWMFGLALDVGILIALYGWGVSWKPAERRPRQIFRPGFTSLVVVLALGLATVGEVQAVDVSHGAEFGTAYGRYTEELGTLNSQSFALWRARLDLDRWRVDVGRAERFDEEGVGLGLSYTRYLGRTTLSAGASTGTGDVLFPRWRIDVGAQRSGFFDDRLTANLGYTHVQSKAENSADGVGAALRIALGGPWSASVDGRVDVGQPGDTVSQSVGLGLQFSHYRRLYLDAGIRFGEVSYLLVDPDEAAIDFSSRSFGLGGAVYLDANTAVSGRLELSDTEIYDLWAFRLGLVRGMVKVRQAGRLDAARVLAFTLALPASIQALVLLLSGLSVPITRTVAAAVLLASLIASARVANWCRDRDPADSFPPPRTWLGARFLAVGLTIWSATLWWRCLVLAWRRPVYDWDGLYYHVPAMQGWVSAQRVVWLEGLHDLPFANGYPMAVETLGFWLHALTGTSRLVDAGNLLLWPLGAVSLWVIAAEIGARGAGRWIAAASLPMAPAFVILAATCYVEPAFACAASALLATTLRWVRRPSWSATVLTGMAAGLALGIKGLGLPLGLSFIAAALTAGILARASSRPTFLQLLALVLVALAIGGSWMGRNLAHTGNPTFPIALGIAGWELTSGYEAHGMIDGNLSEELRSWPRVLRPLRGWLQLDAPIRGMESSEGMGFVWLLGGLPLLLWGAWRGSDPRLGLPRWIALAALALLLVQPGAWWARFTLWLHAIGLPAVGRALVGPSPDTKWVLRLGLVLLLGLGVAESEIALRAQQLLGRAPDGEGRLYLPTVDRYFPDLEKTEGFDRFWAAPAIARSRWGHVGTLLGGILSLPLDQRRIEVLPTIPTVADFEALGARGIEWVLWDQVGAGPLPADIRALVPEIYQYRRNDDVHFLALRLREPTAI